MHSSIASHCIAYACSDDASTAFRRSCIGDHDESCPYCESADEVLKCVKGALESYHTSKDTVNYKEMLHQVDQAFENINAFRNHIIRSVVQELEWDELRKKIDENTVFLTGKTSQIPVYFSSMHI